MSDYRVTMKGDRRRLGFKCYHCNWEGYVELKWYEDLKPTSTTIIAHKDDRSGEKDKICYCPECDDQSRRANFIKSLNPWKLKEKVVFSAKEMSLGAGLEGSGEGGMEGLGLYEGED